MPAFSLHAPYRTSLPTRFLAAAAVLCAVWPSSAYPGDDRVAPLPTATEMMAVLNEPCRALGLVGDSFTVEKAGVSYTAHIEEATSLGAHESFVKRAIPLTVGQQTVKYGVYALNLPNWRQAHCRGPQRMLNGQTIVLPAPIPPLTLTAR